jgi:hypothetical protein
MLHRVPGKIIDVVLRSKELYLSSLALRHACCGIADPIGVIVQLLGRRKRTHFSLGYDKHDRRRAS